jgi:hypothetical protein
MVFAPFIQQQPRSFVSPVSIVGGCHHNKNNNTKQGASTSGKK